MSATRRETGVADPVDVETLGYLKEAGHDLVPPEFWPMIEEEIQTVPLDRVGGILGEILDRVIAMVTWVPNPAPEVVKFAPGLVPVLKHGDPSRPGYSMLHPNGAHSAGGTGRFAAWGERSQEIEQASRIGPTQESILAAGETMFTPAEDDLRSEAESLYNYEIADAVDRGAAPDAFDFYHEYGRDPDKDEAAEMRDARREQIVDEIVATYRDDIISSMAADGGYKNMTPFDADTMRDEMGEVFNLRHPVIVNGRRDTMESEVVMVEPLSEYESANGSPGVKVYGNVTNEAGDRVGEFQREITIEGDGTMRVEHSLLDLRGDDGSGDYQGKGFAGVFNRQAENYYISHGADRIDVHSALSGGGYAWARQGYDFKSPGTVPYRVEDHLTKAAGTLHPKVEADLRSISTRFSLRFDDPDYPTPMEVANVGRVEGASTWPGKDIMRGSDWYGVKPLQPGGTRVSWTVQDAAAAGGVQPPPPATQPTLPGMPN
jgi:hypothetical protein